MFLKRCYFKQGVIKNLYDSNFKKNNKNVDKKKSKLHLRKRKVKV